MRFNDKEMSHVCLLEADLEGRLNYKKLSGSNINQSGGGFKERWFKLRANLLFYFRINEVGQIDHRQPHGVFVLENSHVQTELSTGIPFAFSMTFSDDPERKHLFTARTEDTVHRWVSAIKKATYEHLRSQMIVLQQKIRCMTGKDPLLMYPHNRGTIRNVDDDDTKESSFQSHVPILNSESKPDSNLIEL